MLQQQAAAAVADGARGRVVDLARLGARGAQPSHIQRDLDRLVGRGRLQRLREYVLEAPRRSLSLGVELYPRAMMLPHDVFASIAEHRPAESLGTGDQISLYLGYRS